LRLQVKRGFERCDDEIKKKGKEFPGISTNFPVSIFVFLLHSDRLTEVNSVIDFWSK
jgi:hypothetical protein